MKSSKLFFPFLIFLLAISLILPAQKVDSTPVKQHGFFIGAYVGVPSFCTMGQTREAVEINSGFKQFAITGRFYRTFGNGKYFFENSMEVGWRKKFHHCFANTLSVGFSDLAFEKEQISIPIFGSQNFRKTQGLIFEEKLDFNFHRTDHTPSFWGIAGSYYCIFNSIEYVQGWSVGIDFTVDNNLWRSQNPVTQKRVVPIFDSIPYKFRIRTNLITGMFFSPHIDFEYRKSKHWGYGISALWRPDNRGVVANLSYAFDNPDVQLKGFGAFVDLIYFAQYYSESRGRYWSFALRCGYRNLFRERFSVGRYSSAYAMYTLTRLRQDIVSDLRISYIIPLGNSPVILDCFCSFGLRTSFYKTQFFSNSFPNPSYYDGPIRVYTNAIGFPANGCYVLPEFNAGLEIGFGW